MFAARCQPALGLGAPLLLLLVSCCLVSGESDPVEETEPSELPAEEEEEDEEEAEEEEEAEDDPEETRVAAAKSLETCRADGFVPPAYRRHGLEDDGRIDLASGWRVVAGDPKGVQAPEYDDSEAETFDAPGFYPMTFRGKLGKVWFRRAFDVPEGVTELDLDLGRLAGTVTVYVNGEKIAAPPTRGAPIFKKSVPVNSGSNLLALQVKVRRHVGGVYWRGAPALGKHALKRRGFLVRRFQSKVDRSNQKLTLYIPRCADLRVPMPLVVALPGWGGNIYSFAHSALLTEAETRQMLVLVPDPRGNVLYTGAAEAGVLEAIDLVSKDFPIDKRKIALTGVSMGGAGALQIGFHYPDRFAAIAAFYGDSKYDMSGYIRRILKTQRTAARYSVINFTANARNLPVLLVHARDDKVSPFAQSQWLADEASRLELPNVKLVAVDKGGHSVKVVEDHVPMVMGLFESSTQNEVPERVTFATSSWDYTRAYWIDVVLKAEGSFGSADISFVVPTTTLVIHKVDSGLEAVRVDGSAFLLARRGRFRIRVEEEPQASVVLANMEGARALHIGQEGKEPAVRPIERGQAVLESLSTGIYEVTVR